ncbi:Xaa-Pro aminopeptidase [Solemya pervernicosa gill symbiont]|uniref:Xaa-Pro aminopeptidase n=2 Tax=Gammaproteobacteria incertae sedis TaxID=118884 RepID=A0A1T2L336_9GAMM|nr:Xaa-Pro aminopeptidase [Candidatus Reidiella endopervernicosa]OOZ39491.1 Xaa-Pro aminopeptidase [Solemya pervernicosa gill symbiont]QKQ25884.1 Xaa-Pro aminopeptidase [Candidatus Reidiella endopervernicosa]
MSPKEFVRRRKHLMSMMGEGAIALLPAAPVQIRNRDAEHHYRQDSDFMYLTGFPEPEAVLVLIPGRKQGQCILFCREQDPSMTLWNGPMAGLEGAVESYGADDAFPISDLDEILPGLLEERETVCYTMGARPDFDQRVMGWVNQVRSKSRSGVHAPEEFVSLDHLLHELRLFKSRAELKAMREAATISVKAHKRAMKICKPGMYEYEIEAEYLHEFRRHNSVPAYSSIVGGGNNGCVLHYVDNRDELRDGDLLLIDAAAEVECYAADITRTFPVNGKFSPAQRALYEVVLDAQLAAIKAVKPGNHWNDPHDATVRVITEGLLKLGLLKGKLDNMIESEAYKRFYMHRVGHWLGMDVHDVGDYKIGDEWRMLEPGMVLTIEPGIYIPIGSKGVAKKWQGIGIRIEDDVVVTKDGHLVLSEKAPKHVDEIEALMNG